jgi:uncharacterized protein YjiS (DUF1127 family)
LQQLKQRGAAHEVAPQQALATVSPSTTATECDFMSGYDNPSIATMTSSRYAGELAASFIWSVTKAVRRVYLRWRRQRRAAAAMTALPDLDDRMLRDIGLRRGDLPEASRDERRIWA